MEIIGEAVKHLPKRIRDKFSDIPWRGIAGTRDVLIHEYFGVDPKRLWKSVKEDLPILESRVKEIIEKEF